ncbi:hypothetical protein HMPREF0044_1393 [Gleimia coleocanis DSM 15436]|uniref:Glycerate kinase n=1 Tax=Gleimia coleocanis DSM 15436 TaxID=525245 RepID=C0W1V3_9ACTO|nr:glycerate kinase [Gleimia coleocanis]EEH63469.1 hypothetical protein HMPREF0044_1393 [Gleimia coleocanis DSM 15436]
MSVPFRKVVVVGAPLSAGGANDIALSAKSLSTEVEFSSYGASALEVSDFLTSTGMHVINLNQLNTLDAWACAPQVTTLIADHETMPRDLFSPELPTWQWGGGIGFLGSLAGWSLADLRAALDCPPSEMKELASQLILSARARLAGRQLQVLYLSQRPLLGADSVLSMDPDAMPVWGMNPADMQRVTAFYQAATDFLVSENLLATNRATPDSNPARADGSGAGYGIGAAVSLLRGFRGRCLDVYFQKLNLASELNGESLLVALMPQLHPQTAGDSLLGDLKEISTKMGIPLIVFADENSLSKHELAEWNITAAYAGERNPKTLGDYQRILTQTWLRTR